MRLSSSSKPSRTSGRAFKAQEAEARKKANELSAQAAKLIAEANRLDPDGN